MAIHPTAIVNSSAKIANNAVIGPYCIIDEDVEIGAETILDAHIHVYHHASIGEKCRFYSHCSVGSDPQDLKYQGEATRIRIGNSNVFREFATLNRGTVGGGGITTIGDHNFFMAGAHVAHDSHIGNQVIMANAATLAGHVSVDDHATVGAFSGVHQFCRVGTHAFIGGYSVITRDALPYIKTVGDRNQAKIYGINTIGLQRKGLPESSIEELKQAYRILFRLQLNTSDALNRMRDRAWTAPEVSVLVQFVETSQRGFVR